MDEKIERTEQDKEKLSAGNSTAPAQETEEYATEASPKEESSERPPQAEAPAGEAEEKDSPVTEEDAPQAKHEAEEPEATAEGMKESPEEAEAPKEEDSAPEEAKEAPLELAKPVKKRKVVRKKFTKPAPETPPPPPSGPAAKVFDALSYAGLPLLIVFAAAMTFLEVWQVRDLWFSDEVRLADAFMNLRNGDWLMLTLNGLPYPDKPPLYFWFMEALCLIPGVTMPMVFFLAVAVSHALFIGSIWLLARGTGHDRRVAFASGLIALSCLYISGAACYPRMDLLFAAVVTLGMTCLYRGWIKSFAPFWLTAGFLLMGVATLIKSPLGIAFAVVASILFLFWRGTPGRLNGRDGLPGFLLMLLLIAAWLGMLYLEGHQDYLRDMLGTQLAGRVLQGGHHAEVWWYYLAAIPIIWAPWVLIILFVNWFAALRGIPAAWKSRRENGGSSWLWIWFFSGVAMLSCVQAKMAVYALPLLAPLAVLTGRSLLRLTPGRSRCFFSLTSTILALAGLALVLVDVFPLIRPYVEGFLPPIPAVVNPWLDALDGTMYMGGILVLLAVVLLFFTRLSMPGGALLVTSIGMIALLQPYHFFVAPSMDKLLSPRAQAAAMAEKVKEGYAPAAFHVYPGAYAWHLNEIMAPAGKRLAVPDLADEKARDAWLKAHPKAVMAMPKADWEAWEGKPAGAETILTAWMVHKPYVVAVFNEGAPAAPSAETHAAAQAPAPEQTPEVPAQIPENTPQAPAPTAPAPETPAASAL